MDISLIQLQLAEYIGLAFVVIILLILLASSIKIVREYERMVIFRLGRLLGAKGPGLFFIIPIIDKGVKVDLRVVTLDVPKQKIITLDNVTVDVDAVIYLRVNEPINAVIKVNDYLVAASMLSQTTLRDVIGQVNFDELLSKRDDINKKIQDILDAATDPWGIKITAVAIKDVSLPENMHRAIAKQAEAEREKRGRIITAEGELKAAEMMAQAAEFYAKHPSAMRLRELQTWTEIAREKNMIVVTGGDSNIGSMLGLMKELSSNNNEEKIKEMIRKEVIDAIKIGVSEEQSITNVIKKEIKDMLEGRKEK